MYIHQSNSNNTSQVSVDLWNNVQELVVQQKLEKMDPYPCWILQAYFTSMCVRQVAWDGHEQIRLCLKTGYSPKKPSRDKDNDHVLVDFYSIGLVTFTGFHIIFICTTTISAVFKPSINPPKTGGSIGIPTIGRFRQSPVYNGKYFTNHKPPRFEQYLKMISWNIHSMVFEAPF